MEDGVGIGDRSQHNIRTCEFNRGQGQTMKLVIENDVPIHLLFTIFCQCY